MDVGGTIVGVCVTVGVGMIVLVGDGSGKVGVGDGEGATVFAGGVGVFIAGQALHAHTPPGPLTPSPPK